MGWICCFKGGAEGRVHPRFVLQNMYDGKYVYRWAAGTGLGSIGGKQDVFIGS